MDSQPDSKYNRRLGTAEIIQIKQRLAARRGKKPSLRSIARDFECAYTSVYYIYTGKRHADINADPPITWEVNIGRDGSRVESRSGERDTRRVASAKKQATV